MPAENERDLLKDALVKIRTLRAQLKAAEQARAVPIAIIGMACRFPGGATTPDAYWDLLRNGSDAVCAMPEGRWDVDAYYDPDPDASGKAYVRHGGFLGEVDRFDADFFGISPREAITLDPQQRLMLEVSWEALENAGLAPDRLRGSSTGVYAGVMGNDYAFRQAHDIHSREIDPYMLTGNDPSFSAGRLAYFLGLQGPAMAVATACSSSLVSVHLACQALRAGECDQALAGGVSLILDPITNVMLSRLRALSKDGRCKTFDASADGYGRGEGCGVIVLKRLPDALENGDRILAVIRGSAVNHDGPSAGLTVPNGPAQEKLIRKALQAAGVASEEIGYVEAHGTGTALGDPIEVRAIARVLGERTSPLLVGSVKTNLGHLEAAAGIAGVIKVVLALQNKQIPPHLHFNSPSPHIPWSEIPVRVPTELTDWTERKIAGVSSFGLSGVNAHVIVEEAPSVTARETPQERHVLAVSARSAEALQELAHSYDEYLARHPELDWADVCFTANAGRAHFQHRLAVIARSTHEAREKLQNARGQFTKALIVEAADTDVEKLAGMYLQGATVDWASVYGNTFRRVALPTYPFQRQSYWALDRERSQTTARVGGGPLQAFEAQAEAVLGLVAIADRDRPLIDLGLDSLMGVELKSWTRNELGVDLELRELLSGASTAEVLQLLSARLGQYEPVRAEKGMDAPVYPLSYGQRALWFIHQSDPESPAYNVGIALRVRSKLDVERLKKSFQVLAGRHASLRLTFSASDGEPIQSVSEQAVWFESVDASGWSEDDLAAQVSAAHRRPFDLATGPILRVTLYSRSEQEYVLLIAMHHIGCDALSYWTLLEELRTIYGSDSSPELPKVTYADFVQWQSEMLAGPEGDRLWSYWRRQLSGELAVLNLPADYPRPSVQTYNGATHLLRVPEQVAQALRDLSRAQTTTLYTTLLAAFQVLLHRYTGQDDIIVGSATAGRPSQFAGVIGYFVNPVPIRADLSADPEFVSFLEQIRQTTLDALEHQQFPFPLLVERLQPKRDQSRSPIFQADFALRQGRPSHLRELPSRDLAFEPFELHEEEGQFDLSLHITDNGGDLSAAFKYNTDLFTAKTIERMAECFRVLLDGITVDPHRRVSKIPLLSDAERHRILACGTGKAVEYPAICVQQMFEDQAAQTPNAIAVEFDGQRLTYGELNRRANRIARHLRTCGVGPEVLAGVCLERSSELVVALLGVLKAGGAYLPLDPAYPTERLAFMMSDARARVLLTSKKAAQSVRNIEDISIIYVDEMQGEEDSNLPCEAGLGNLAYVIYTSGSTGRPKGAMITHHGLTNYLSWCTKEYRVADGCGAPLNSSIGFDATITSLWPPLVTGGKIILTPEEQPIEALTGILQASRDLSLVKITPAHLEILSQMLPAAECAERANAFVIGGEALRGDMLSFWQQSAPQTRLINEYGPTETVVGCCVYEASSSIPGSVPIGRPIANTELYVLDRNMRPVPFGVPGELYIGGAGVARGYLNRPGLTASRFVPDAFSGRSGARLYRTGDLVRYLPDGNLDFLGRIDMQVKIRGYRIEPGEIESLLGQHPNVAECVVLVRGEAGNKYLAAYVVSAEEPPSASELRRYLAEKLPEYMVPSFFITLDELPLTPNGKIDRNALPRPEYELAESNFVAPRDPLEMKLAAIWEEVLGSRRVGVKDNFFDLGGHSLLAVRLMARIQQEFEAEVPLAAILRGPTVEQLARILRQQAPSSLRSSLVPIQPGGSKPPLFCVPGAGGNAIYLYNLARQLGPEQPFYGLQGVGLDGEVAPHTTVEEMAAHYIDAIQSVQPSGPYSIGGHSLGGWVAFEMARQLERSGEEVSLLAIIDTPVPVPERSRDVSDWDSARWILELTQRIAQLLNPELKVPAESLRGLSFEEQLHEFRDALIRTELFPREGSIDHLRNVLELFKAHSQVQYRIAGGALRTPITLFRTHSAPAHLASLDGDPTWGWGSVGKVEVHHVPGEHLTVLRPPHVKVLAEKIGSSLAEAAPPVLLEV